MPSPHSHGPHPVETVPGDPACGLLLLCDHASNHVPDDLGRLGVPDAEFSRHIAYDIGAAGVTRRLAALLGAPAVLTTFSRLVIDPNRGRDDPTLVMRLSDGAVVPGNARIDEAGKAERIARFYEPYDRAIDAHVAAAMAAGAPPAIVTIHSFTPCWRGDPRPWHVGILWDHDDRLSAPLVAGLRADPAGLTVGDNEPYGGGLPGDTVDRHAIARGLPNALVEIRQDLIADEAGEAEWAARFAGLLRPHLAPTA
ncbi:N-formylglutamate amidohydrolase [Methylobacterium sp. Leaf399]|uniref:N-formylglutamate amidohydrolase n=1 Tax=unclassified Methylobacterium TaxID=2615210 RepID=UPI0006FCFEE5|nr:MULTISPECIES: N-formylglutamate amidohydrolase [unclassified Methylobacterium]KQP61594.1 N-formylglutamate amidohydrolase [Methylobacterium sp. Leaf108]KQT19746.1 N-formylglutamate amidohydrolase [Methylobacterium sp. Leaf399]KQT80795.1 N-formylglutamate amidohydrolase [Methylobacterium sp. Leaf466]